MTQDEMFELLIRLDERQEKFIENFEKVAGEVGFPRCAERGEAIDSLKKSVGWIRNTIVGTIFVGLVSVFFSWFSKGS
jgi:hypothetical protein